MQILCDIELFMWHGRRRLWHKLSTILPFDKQQSQKNDEDEREAANDSPSYGGCQRKHISVVLLHSVSVSLVSDIHMQDTHFFVVETVDLEITVKHSHLFATKTNDFVWSTVATLMGHQELLLATVTQCKLVWPCDCMTSCQRLSLKVPWLVVNTAVARGTAWRSGLVILWQTCSLLPRREWLTLSAAASIRVLPYPYPTKKWPVPVKGWTNEKCFVVTSVLKWFIMITIPSYYQHMILWNIFCYCKGMMTKWQNLHRKTYQMVVMLS